MTVHPVDGAAAGLSAALVLGRARRPIGHDGRSPTDLDAAAHRGVAAHPTGEVRQAEVRSGSRLEGRIDPLVDGSGAVVAIVDDRVVEAHGLPRAA